MYTGKTKKADSKEIKRSIHPPCPKCKSNEFLPKHKKAVYPILFGKNGKNYKKVPYKCKECKHEQCCWWELKS